MARNKPNDEKFMRLALRLAQKGRGTTSPNPLVGAVVVKNSKIVGRGYHQKAGSAHAEVIALDEAGRAARDARLYVSLEPCCHFGRTPACVRKIVRCGIKEVVFAMGDPNPLNNGKGAAYLRRHGIKVKSGVLEKEARQINQVFVKYITRRLPFVTVKVAQSLDGKIATAWGSSRWISSLSSRNLTQRLRSRVDAVLVGVNTVLKDDPLLSCRINGRLHQRQPKKVVLDSHLRLRPDLKIFSARSPAPVIIATTRFAPPKKISAFANRAQVLLVRDKDSRVDLRDLMRRLARQGLSHVLIEGGGQVIASALKEGLVDRLIVVIAPKIIGGRGAPTAVEGEGIKDIAEAIRLVDLKLGRSGADLVIEGRPIVHRNY